MVVYWVVHFRSFCAGYCLLKLERPLLHCSTSLLTSLLETLL